MWERFLRSLETEGGKTVLIIFMLMFLVAVTMIMIISGHTIQDATRTLLVGAFSSLLGILYGYLKAGGPGVKSPDTK
jgi:1,4-dihydroxy-2-naphthoate octaprenyltransferase